MLMWLIDDSPGNHDYASNTVARFSNVSLVGFYTGAEAISAYQQCEADDTAVPDVILMDYYLSGERGDQITRELRACEGKHHPLIVGYSSVTSASAAIVAAGADIIVRKHVDDRGINPSLATWLTKQVKIRQR